MFDRDEERRLELECLRLAADFRQIASDTLNPDLKIQCLRMAKIWADQTPDPTIWASAGASPIDTFRRRDTVTAATMIRNAMIATAARTPLLAS